MLAIKQHSQPECTQVYAHLGWREVSPQQHAFLHNGGALFVDGVQVDLTETESLARYKLPDRPPDPALLDQAIKASLDFLKVDDPQRTYPLCRRPCTRRLRACLAPRRANGMPGRTKCGTGLSISAIVCGDEGKGRSAWRRTDWRRNCGDGSSEHTNIHQENACIVTNFPTIRRKNARAFCDGASKAKRPRLGGSQGCRRANRGIKPQVGLAPSLDNLRLTSRKIT